MISISYFAKAAVNLGRKQVWSLIWGTIGSVLAPGSILDRRRSGFPDSGSGKSGKTGNREKCHVTYQIKALFKLVDVDHTKIRISGFWIRKIRKKGKK